MTPFRRILNLLVALVISFGGFGALASPEDYTVTLSDTYNVTKCRVANPAATPGAIPTVNGDTKWVNINLDSFIPNAQCWMNDTFFTIKTFRLFKIMAGFGSLVLLIFFFKQMLDGWTTRNFNLIVRTVFMSIVASVLINDAANAGTIANQVYSIPIQLWRTLYAQSSGLVSQTVQQNVTENTQKLATTTGLFVMNSMLATSAMINTEINGKEAFAADVNDASGTTSASAINLTSQNAVARYADKQNKDFSDSVKSMSWVFQIGYMVLLGFFMSFAGIIYFSGLSIILCMFALPLAIAFWAVGDSKPIQLIFKTVLVSLATVSIVPIIMSVAADLAIIQPTYTIQAQMQDAQKNAESVITDYVNHSVDCDAAAGSVITKAVTSAADVATAGSATALQKVQCEMTNKVPVILQEFAAGTLRIVIGMCLMIMTMLMCIGIGVALMRHTPALLSQLFGGANQGSDHNNNGAIAGGVLGGVAQGAISLAGKYGKKPDGSAALKGGQPGQTGPSKLASPVGRAIDTFNARTGRPMLAGAAAPAFAMTSPSRNVLTTAGRTTLRSAMVNTLTAPVTSRTAALGAALTNKRHELTGQVKTAVQDKAKAVLAQVVARAEPPASGAKVNLTKAPSQPTAPYGAVRNAPVSQPTAPAPYGAVRIQQVTAGSGAVAGVTAVSVKTIGSTTTSAALAGAATVSVRPPARNGTEPATGFGPVQNVTNSAAATTRPPAPYGAGPGINLPQHGVKPAAAATVSVVSGTAAQLAPIRETLSSGKAPVTLNPGGVYAAAHPNSVDANDKRQAKLDRQAQATHARNLTAAQTATRLIGLAVRERISTSIQERQERTRDARTANRLEKSGKVGLSAEARADHRAVKAAVIGHNRTERLNAANSKSGESPNLIRYADAKAALMATGRLPSQKGIVPDQQRTASGHNQGSAGPRGAVSIAGQQAHERRVASKDLLSPAGSGKEGGVRAPLGAPVRLNRAALAVATGTARAPVGRYQGLAKANLDQQRAMKQAKLKRQAYAAGPLSRVAYESGVYVRQLAGAARPKLTLAVKDTGRAAGAAVSARVSQNVMDARDRRAVIDRNNHDNQKQGQYSIGLQETRAAMVKERSLPSQKAQDAVRKEQPERIQARDRTAINNELQRYNAEVDRRNERLKEQNPYNRLEPHRTAEQQNRQMRFEGILPSQIAADRDHVRAVQAAHNTAEERRAEEARRKSEPYEARYVTEREVRHTLALKNTPGSLPSQKDTGKDAYMAGVRLSRDVNAVIENERAVRRGDLSRWTSDQEDRKTYDPRDRQRREHPQAERPERPTGTRKVTDAPSTPETNRSSQRSTGHQQTIRPASQSTRSLDAEARRRQEQQAQDEYERLNTDQP